MLYEAEFVSGLIDVVQDEISSVIAHDGRIRNSYRDDSLQFTFDGDIERLKQLRTVISVYALLQFDIPRPKALLGHEHFHRLLARIQNIIIISHATFENLYVNAAGSDSSVMVRIKQELSQALGLTVVDDEGDLLIRIRRSPSKKHGWDVLVRLTPRPLATREWRLCNFAGALNASVASAIVNMTNPTPTDRFLNISCGSGTIMIERQALMPTESIIGVDINYQTLDCAKQNVEAASTKAIQLVQSDAIQLPLASASIDKLVADLPFGLLSGSHDENEWLYPAILNEAARVARLKAPFVVITQEVKLMQEILDITTMWDVKDIKMINLSGLHPRIYLLERS